MIGLIRRLLDKICGGECNISPQSSCNCFHAEIVQMNSQLHLKNLNPVSCHDIQINTVQVDMNNEEDLTYILIQQNILLYNIFYIEGMIYQDIKIYSLNLSVSVKDGKDECNVIVPVRLLTIDDVLFILIDEDAIDLLETKIHEDFSIQRIQIDTYDHGTVANIISSYDIDCNNVISKCF